MLYQLSYAGKNRKARIVPQADTQRTQQIEGV
jgi:hypothetical protein